MEIITYNLLLAVVAYILGVASPGPSNLAIAHISLHSGRARAIMFANGVMIGSFLWGMIVALGLSSVLMEYPNILHILKTVAGAYFLYLGYTAFRKVFASKPLTNLASDYATTSNMRQFLSGVLFHLLNPKALAVWTTIIAIALPANTTLETNAILFIPVIACLPPGMLIFYGYAFIFSRQAVVEKYFKYSKIINSVVGVTFASIGAGLILSNQ